LGEVEQDEGEARLLAAAVVLTHDGVIELEAKLEATPRWQVMRRAELKRRLRRRREREQLALRRLDRRAPGE
jgi:hypothetical protein